MVEIWLRRGLLVEELLQALPPLLDEILLKYPVIPPKRKLPEQRFSRERRDDHLEWERRRNKQQKNRIRVGVFVVLLKE